MKTIIITTAIILASLTAAAQQIGIEAAIHHDGTVQTGITVTEAVQCFGAYVNVLSHEDNRDDYTRCDTVINITGLTTGIIYSINYDRLKTLSIGAGRILTETIDKFNHDTNYKRSVKFIIETKASIYITRNIEFVTGISSQPAIMAGIRLSIN